METGCEIIEWYIGKNKGKKCEHSIVAKSYKHNVIQAHQVQSVYVCVCVRAGGRGEGKEINSPYSKR